MKKISKNLTFFILSYIAVLAIQCRYTVVLSDLSPQLVNVLNRLIVTCENIGFTDIFAWIAVFLMLKKLDSLESRCDIPTVIFSFIMSILLTICLSFKNQMNLSFLIGNFFQVLVSSFTIAGLAISVYCVTRLLYLRFWSLGGAQNSWKFLEKHLFPIGFISILGVWSVWSFLNYPGTYCPDSVRQLSEYLGDNPLSSWQPPFSTFLMGICFTIGQKLIDANFGFYLYCLLQQLAGALIFAYGAKVLKKIGAPLSFCIGSILFFACLPLWGIHAQWHDKDLLYAEFCTLLIILIMEIIKEKTCSLKQAVFLLLSGLITCLLRNNGIYTVLPVLVVLGIWLKKSYKIRIFVSAAALIVLYLGVTNLFYPAIGIAKGSIGEALSVPIQQTARYVCLYDSELTEEEKKVISDNFHYDALFSYDPVISDPVKNHFYAGDLKGYAKVWVRMFFKHPMCYVEAFLAKGYGYLAPVELGIETWVGNDFDSYLIGQGILHPFSESLGDILRQIMFISEMWPISRLTFVPGFYSWILFIISFLLLRKKKYPALILFIPAYMNVLICLASPLHNAMRYMLPTVAMIPYLVGFARSYSES